MARKSRKAGPGPTRKRPATPLDIELPFEKMLPGGAFRVMLPTLAQLEAFWNANRESFAFAAEGLLADRGQEFMHEYEWIFAPSTQALVKAVYRWDEWGIRPIWYDWATAEPLEHEAFFGELDEVRATRTAEGSWTADEEAGFRSRTPETYRGWWKLHNLPALDDMGWFDEHHVEITDPAASLAEVAAKLQDATFWTHKRWQGLWEIYFHTAEEVGETIASLRNSRQRSSERMYGYYGCENELPAACARCWVSNCMKRHEPGPKISPDEGT